MPMLVHPFYDAVSDVVPYQICEETRVLLPFSRDETELCLSFLLKAMACSVNRLVSPILWDEVKVIICINYPDMRLTERIF